MRTLFLKATPNMNLLARCVGRRRERGNRRAFTFIEILFVVIILAVLIAVAIPQFTKTQRSLQFHSFCRDMHSALRYLHQRSIVEGKAIFLTIDGPKNEYWMRLQNVSGRLKTYPIPRGIRVETDSPSEEFVFYPDGRIGKFSITITSGDNERFTITTQGVFGGVKIQKS